MSTLSLHYWNGLGVYDNMSDFQNELKTNGKTKA